MKAAHCFPICSNAATWQQQASTLVVVDFFFWFKTDSDRQTGVRPGLMIMMRRQYGRRICLEHDLIFFCSGDKRCTERSALLTDLWLCRDTKPTVNQNLKQVENRNAEHSFRELYISPNGILGSFTRVTLMLTHYRYHHHLPPLRHPSQHSPSPTSDDDGVYMQDADSASSYASPSGLFWLFLLLLLFWIGWNCVVDWAYYCYWEGWIQDH